MAIELNKKHLILILSLLLLGSYTYFTGLNSYALQSFDEGWYAVMSQSVIEDGNVLNLQTYDWTNQEIDEQFLIPPLFIWVQSISLLLFGYSELAVRIPSAMSAVTISIIIYWMGCEQLNERSAWIAGLSWLSYPVLFASSGPRQGVEDVFFALLGTLWVYTTYKVVDDNEPAWMLPAGFFAGLTMLTKGFNAAVFLLVLLPLILRNRQLFFDYRHMSTSLGLAALIGGFWPTMMWWQHGYTVIDEFFVKQVVNRVTLQTAGDPLINVLSYPFLKKGATYLDPHIWFILPVSGWLLFSYLQDSGERWHNFILWWFLSFCLAFFPTANHFHYIIPGLIPASLLIGILFDKSLDTEPTALTLTITGIVIIFSISPTYGVFSPLPRALLWENPPTNQFFGRVGVSLLGAILVFQSTAAKIQSYLSSKIPWAVTIATITFLVGLLLTPATGPGRIEQKQAGQYIQESSNKDALIHVVENDGVAFHSFVFYANRKTAPTTISEINQNRSIKYAIVPTNQTSKVERQISNRKTLKWVDYHYHLLSLQSSQINSPSA